MAAMISPQPNKVLPPAAQQLSETPSTQDQQNTAAVKRSLDQDQASNGNDGPAAKRARYCRDYGDIITVLVGGQELPMSVHKKLICSKSGFFQIACDEGRWAEGKPDKTLKLADVESDIFGAYLEYCYTGSFTVDFSHESHEVETEKKHKMLFRMYNFGGFVQDFVFRNSVMFNLVSRTRGWSSWEVVKEGWTSAQADSLLRKMMVDKVAMRVLPDLLVEQMAHCPADMVLKIALKLKMEHPFIGRSKFTGGLSGYMAKA